MKFKYIVFLLVMSCFSIQAQTVSLNSPIVESYLRRQQLLGNFDSAFSFNYRPLTFSQNGLKIDETSAVLNFINNGNTASKKGPKITLLPVEFHLAYDHKHPDSRNDGAMIRSRGFQTYLSGGVFMEYGPLTIQVKPELVWAQNKDYLGFPDKPRHWESTWVDRYTYFNRIDQPERYGEGAYTKFLAGQSSIRLNQWGLSLGLSTENIWWGPARRNSIMMSNNAQGFPHITLNTQRPINIGIGHLEGQFVTARLEKSGFNPPAHDVVFRGRVRFVPKLDDWRYFQAITFSYSPKWVKGLSLGFTRWVQQYSETAKATDDYFPALSNLFRKNDDNVNRNEIERDQAAGIFGRWIWFDANAELYFEFAKNDAAINFRDLLVDTDHSRALTVGISKLFPTPKKDTYYQFSFEWTQMSQTESRIARQAGAWYHHSRVRHGYTHNGEVLGAGLGPGGNGQYLEVSWVKGIRRIGGAIERYVHNNDFKNFSFEDDFSRYWVDYNIHGFVEWDFEHFLVSASLYYTRSLNYQWELVFDPTATPFQYVPGKDRNNYNLDIKLLYIF